MIRIVTGVSDTTIRESVSKHPDNGDYAKTICRNCGCFSWDFMSTKTEAEIVERCEFCENEVVMYGNRPYKLLSQ